MLVKSRKVESLAIKFLLVVDKSKFTVYVCIIVVIFFFYFTENIKAVYITLKKQIYAMNAKYDFLNF